MSASKRGKWSSSFKFVLAAAGSAIGLGNIWRFPYTAGMNGGAVFLFIYLLAVLFLGLPVMYEELSLGRHTQKNPVGAFETIKPRSGWKLVGFLGVLTGICILSYYAVVAGWTVYYIFLSLTGKFSSGLDANTAKAIFESMGSNPWINLIFLALFIGITAYVVSRGVEKGIEKWTSVLMPLLFLILVILAVRALTLPGASKGLSFYLKPDFSKINFQVILMALGQAFFSLSLGMGAMITYGSYLRKEENLLKAGAEVVVFDTLIAFLAGIVIFPTVFSFGLSPSAGPSLVFQTLPFTFSKLPFGSLVATLFFFLLAIAALTSTISLVEVAVAYLVDEHRINRKLAAWVVAGVAFLLGVPSALSGSVNLFKKLPAIGKDFLSLMDFIWGNISLALGALLLTLFVAFVWKAENAAMEIRPDPAKPFLGEEAWKFLVKFIIPIVIALILLNALL